MSSQEIKWVITSTPPHEPAWIPFPRIFLRLDLFWFHGWCTASPRDRFGSGPFLIPWWMRCIAEGSFRSRRMSLFWFHGGCVASPRDRFGSGPDCDPRLLGKGRDPFGSDGSLISRKKCSLPNLHTNLMKLIQKDPQEHLWSRETRVPLSHTRTCTLIMCSLSCGLHTWNLSGA